MSPALSDHRRPGHLERCQLLFSFVNGTLTVTGGAASKLVILSQPSSSAVAGVAFAQQPQIRIEDQYGNLRSSDNSTVVTVARSAGSGTLQGTLSATAVNGVATFANLSHNVANTINLSFSSSGLTSATSANIVVSPAAFTQLQLLVPGETTAPGSASGKTGTPNAQFMGTGFEVTVNAVDAYWNLIDTVSDTVGLTSSDTSATLPAAAALAAGTNNLTVYFNGNGSFTLTATDLSNGSKTPSTSPAISVSGAQFTPRPAAGRSGRRRSHRHLHHIDRTKLLRERQRATSAPGPSSSTRRPALSSIPVAPRRQC